MRPVLPFHAAAGEYCSDAAAPSWGELKGDSGPSLRGAADSETVRARRTRETGSIRGMLSVIRRNRSLRLVRDGTEASASNAQHLHGKCSAHVVIGFLRCKPLVADHDPFGRGCDRGRNRFAIRAAERKG